jgi:hypothetical protein
MRRQACGILTAYSLALATAAFGQAARPPEAGPRKAGEVVIETISVTTAENDKVNVELGTLAQTIRPVPEGQRRGAGGPAGLQRAR